MSKTTTILPFFVLSFFLFFISNSFAIDRIISNVENSDIDLSSESSDSTLTIDSGGVLDANIIMGNSDQTTIFNGGTLNGNVSGAGKIAIDFDSILNGNVDISSTVKISNNATLSVEGGNIEVSIRGESDEVGAVNFKNDNTLFASVGTKTTTLNLVEISNNSTLNTSNKNIDTLFLKINSGSTLNYGGGDIVGTVEGSGSLIFSGSDTTKFDIIRNIDGDELSEIKVNNGSTVTLGKSIIATTINVGEGKNGTLKSNYQSITSDNINIFEGAKLDININSTVSGNINGTINGSGTLQFSGSNNSYSPADSFGKDKKLAEILISNETSLIIKNDISFNADIINIGEGSISSTSVLVSPVLTQNNGSIGADSNSLIRLNSNAIFNYNGGIINGIVRASGAGKGTFNINHDYTSNYEIGKDQSLANLNISSGNILTANADISAQNISIIGILDLGNSAKIITGNLSTSGGSAIIDFGSANHEISGNFSVSDGDILRINALNNSNVGSLKSAGDVAVGENINLQISYDSDSGYLSDGSEIAIISGSSGEVNKVSSFNIDVNNSTSNQSGLLTFNTRKYGSELFLVVDRKGAETFTKNKFSAQSYQNIDKIGSGAIGELRNLQKFIDRTSTANSQRSSALQSTIPQNNQDLNNSSLNSAKSSINITSNRLENSLLRESKNNFGDFPNSKNPKNFSNFSKKENISSLNKLSFDDEIFDDQAIWIQGFGSSATQNDVEDSMGYEYSSQGLAVGVDQEIAKNLRLGVSSSFSMANVESNSSNKKETAIESLQFNLYGGYDFKPYFISAIIGVAVNKYSSIRPMPEMNLIAKADYGGETYMVKFDGGMTNNIDYGFSLTPRISLIMARNQISTYSETGSGTLNLQVSNEKNDSFEGRFGVDLRYDDLEILSTKIKPRFSVSYGYDFLASDQSSMNRFEGQNYSFRIKNSNIDKESLKYGFGLDIYEKNGILMMIDYEVEEKPTYKSQLGSLYFRYGF
ncbi:MAG: hypothetical protein ACJA0S_000295 [Rickettsiales bacterium]|jgi:uncharacterized protein with beta-barrel porin domain